MNLPTNAGKALRVFGVRGSRIGDQLMSAPVLAWLRKRWPDCYIHWQTARRLSCRAIGAQPISDLPSDSMVGGYS